MTKRPRNTDQSAVGIIEKSVQLLRQAPISLLLIYYLGSLPFILGFLYFWGDMSRNPFAAQYCPAASFGLTLLFIFMKCMHSVFAVKVYERAASTTISSWSFSSIGRLIFFQTVIQASGFVVLPAALLITIPYPWAYAFYQNALVQDYRKSARIRDLFSVTSARAAYNPRQNIFVMMILSLFSLFVFFNLGMAVFALPYLIKMLTGIESAVTMGGFNPFNSTFFISICCLTYLSADPLIKVVYVLRGFYGESVKTGSDLLADLQKIPVSKKLTVIIVFIMITVVLSPKISLAGNSAVIPSGSESRHEPDVLTKKLSQSIKDVMKRREFTWRMPKSKQVESVQPGLIDSSSEWIRPYIKYLWKYIKKFIKAIIDFFEKLKPDVVPGSAAQEKNWKAPARDLLFTLLILTGIVLLAYALRLFFSKKEKKPTQTEPVTTTVPDVTDENIRADDLPPDKWLEIALNLMEQGDFRLAIRALYLGTLAKLAEKNLITIVGYKSNRDYQNELTRRAHAKKHLIEAFRETVGVFDRVWYGMYHTDSKDVDLFAQNQKRIIEYAN